MSLVDTLGKVAMGVIVAKGMGKMMGNRSQAGGMPGGSGGGLGDLLGGLLGGGKSGAQQGGGGLGDLLGSLVGGGSKSSGGLADALGGLLGGGGQKGGGLGGLLDSLGGQQQGSGSGSSTSLGELLNQSFSGEKPEVNPEAERQAEVLLSAMLSAAKCDGEIDDAEREKLTKHLGEITPEEAAFIKSEMAKPVDVSALVANVPKGMEQQVYLMSLMAIDLDSQAEAKYLHELAQGLGIDPQQANAIHEQLGVPKLYS